MVLQLPSAHVRLIGEAEGVLELKNGFVVLPFAVFCEGGHVDCAHSAPQVHGIKVEQAPHISNGDVGLLHFLVGDVRHAVASNLPGLDGLLAVPEARHEERAIQRLRQTHRRTVPVPLCVHQAHRSHEQKLVVAPVGEALGPVLRRKQRGVIVDALQRRMALRQGICVPVGAHCRHPEPEPR
eukprot:CAMPEP_0114320452 /NCGR_PEP_ID=MMETSP0059-20121206/25952_1 /TAXON_ID=36894 /ORGANISM="Pyramimonas parkeae, Strain CCMP726" /LENGTH=181 /DNA_ID=CAMNT_0001447867 /DNA_START=422 /DNA_END=962 /DNA_ORIENTATION=+